PADEAPAIVAAKRLATIGSRGEYLAFHPVPRADEPGERVEVRQPGDDQALRIAAARDEIVAVAIARDAVVLVRVRQPGARGAGGPARQLQEGQRVHDLPPEQLRIDHALLHADERRPRDVRRHDQIRAGDDEFVAAAHTAEIDVQAVAAQVAQAL